MNGCKNISEIAVLGAGSPNQSPEGLVRGKAFSKNSLRVLLNFIVCLKLKVNRKT